MSINLCEHGVGWHEICSKCADDHRDRYKLEQKLDRIIELLEEKSGFVYDDNSPGRLVKADGTVTNIDWKDFYA